MGRVQSGTPTNTACGNVLAPPCNCNVSCACGRRTIVAASSLTLVLGLWRSTKDAQAVRARDASMFGADLQSLIQAEQNTSALRIQSWVRFMGSKRLVQSQRELRAAMVVQTAYRRKMAARVRFQQEQVARNTRAELSAVLQIQARIRTWRPKAQLRQLKQDATDRRRAHQEARFKERMKQQYKLEMEERKRQAQAIADAAKKKKGKKSWNGSNACSPRPRGNMKLKDLGRSQSMPVQSSPKAVRRSAEVPASAARRRNHFRRGVNVVMSMNQLLHDKAPGKLDLVNVHSRIDTGRLPTLVPALLLESESESDEAISRSALPVPNTSESEGGSSASAEYDPWTTFSPRQQAILKEGAQHRGARSSRAGEAVLLAPESSAQLRSWPERARENLGTAPAHGSPASPHLRRFHSLDA